LLELPNTLQALSTHILDSAQTADSTVPAEVGCAGLQVAVSCAPLALALQLSRNDAMHLACGMFKLADAVCSTTSGGTAMFHSLVKNAAALGTQIASLLVQLLHTMFGISQSYEPALEVAAVTAPPNKLLPLLHRASCVLLEALEAGERRRNIGWERTQQWLQVARSWEQMIVVDGNAPYVLNRALPPACLCRWARLPERQSDLDGVLPGGYSGDQAGARLSPPCTSLGVSA
jgi:hypothetical protein